MKAPDNLFRLKLAARHLNDAFIARHADKSVEEVVQAALVQSLEDIGAPALPEQLESVLRGPIVLQVVRLRNVSAPTGVPPRIIDARAHGGRQPRVVARAADAAPRADRWAATHQRR